MHSGKFAATISDRYIGVLKAFIDHGWQPLKLFTAPITTHMANNQQAIELAQRYKIPIQLHRMDESDLAELRHAGCDLLVLGSYQWKIGNWTKYLPRAINFHPAPLPQYRGPYPLVQGILDRRNLWASTCHKVAQALDTGDILAIRHFEMEYDECHESLDLKVQIETRQLANHVAANLDSLWDSAYAQGPGSYIKMWTDDDRQIDFNETVDAISLRLRAFGNFECLATINGMRYFVRRAICWPVAHDCLPGTLTHVDGSHLVIACLDGCVALLDWSLVPPGTRIQSAMRQA